MRSLGFAGRPRGASSARPVRGGGFFTDATALPSPRAGADAAAPLTPLAEAADLGRWRTIVVHKARADEAVGVAVARSARGVFVSKVRPAGLGAKAGLEVGQFVYAVNGVPIDDVETATMLVEYARGDVVFRVDAAAAERIAGLMPKAAPAGSPKPSDLASDATHHHEAGEATAPTLLLLGGPREAEPTGGAAT